MDTLEARQRGGDQDGEDWLWVEPAECEDRSSGPSPQACSEAGDATSACTSPSSETVADLVLAQPLLGNQQAPSQPTSAASSTLASPPQPQPQQEPGQRQQAGAAQADKQQQAPQLPTAPQPPRQQHALMAAVAAASAGLTASAGVCCELAQFSLDMAKREWYRLLEWLDKALAHAQTSLQYASAGACCWLDSAGAAATVQLQQAGEAATACVEVVNWALRQQVQRTKQLRYSLPKSLQSPSWALLSVGAVTTLSAVAIGSLMWTNQHLSHQLKQRDRELAQLVMRIMHLQESLHSSRAAVPVVRHLMQPGGAGFMVSHLA